MRAEAGPNEAEDRGQKLRQAELDRHTDALLSFAEQVRQDSPDAGVCTLILRSAKSAPARALTQMKDTLVAAGIQVNVILLKVDPEEELHEFLATLNALAPGTDIATLVRWARHPRLVDAHEQAVYGSELCWTGDAVRRDADKRNPLALFESTPDAIVRGAHAFRALWAISESVPAHLLDMRASASRANTDEKATVAPVAALRPPAEGWPLVRH